MALYLDWPAGTVSFYLLPSVGPSAKRTHLHTFHCTFSGALYPACWSYLGRQSQGQQVSLRRDGCLFTDTVQHEVLHALGFHHEQVRSDRDDHVSILQENIRPGTEQNFAKQPTNNLGTPYDFESVMHYSKYAFSRNGEPTIVSKADPDMEFGSATTMSQNDIARVNALYQCDV
uniref:high choriolytic enzyme 1-like n=1 Tax=Gasterosteus aculeatus aculeatus TaxID=481459 RepID=UPI001A9A0322|nr:high choriolytic enzyme 1-like [Gasterosteus aculeatus aculeatus]